MRSGKRSGNLSSLSMFSMRRWMVHRVCGESGRERQGSHS